MADFQIKAYAAAGREPSKSAFSPPGGGGRGRAVKFLRAFAYSERRNPNPAKRQNSILVHIERGTILMARGRKRQPTHLKLITGTFRRDRASKNEPRPELAIPSVPPELSDDAKLEWARVSGELFRLGLLTNIDRAALAAYCDSYGIWVRAERLLRKIEAENGAAGLVTKGSRGLIAHPLLRMSRRAAAESWHQRLTRFCQTFDRAWATASVSSSFRRGREGIGDFGIAFVPGGERSGKLGR
jgi:P27 family predicted phage terminase small subunit